MSLQVSFVLDVVVNLVVSLIRIIHCVCKTERENSFVTSPSATTALLMVIELCILENELGIILLSVVESGVGVGGQALFDGAIPP